MCAVKEGEYACGNIMSRHVIEKEKLEKELRRGERSWPFFSWGQDGGMAAL